MASPFTAITNDICIQEGTFAFNYIASGTILQGQGVKAGGGMYVIEPSGNGVPQKGCVGIAAYSETKGNPIAVYGPGNIVRYRVSSTSVAAGNKLALAPWGLFGPTGASAKHLGVMVALEDEGTALTESKGLFVG